MALRRSFSSAAAAAGTQEHTLSLAASLGLPEKYGNWINGQMTAPSSGEYFDSVSPINGQSYIQAARGNKADVDSAVASARDTFKNSWKNVSVTERSNILLKCADVIEANAERLAKIETIDNGKAVRESMAAAFQKNELDHLQVGVIDPNLFTPN